MVGNNDRLSEYWKRYYIVGIYIVNNKLLKDQIFFAWHNVPFELTKGHNMYKP